jgi:hypothetical protein
MWWIGYMKRKTKELERALHAVTMRGVIKI